MGWRDVERKLTDIFRALGMKPEMCQDFPYTKRTNGDWYVQVGGRELCITEMARLFASGQ